MPSCRHSPRHYTASGKLSRSCKTYKPKRKLSPKKDCCVLDKSPRPKGGKKCGSVEVRGRRGKVTVYRGPGGGVYYLTQTNAKKYIDPKDCPKACGPGAKRKRSKSPKRKRSKSPKRRRSKSPKRHTSHVHVTRTSLKRKYLKDKVLHGHSK